MRPFISRSPKFQFYLPRFRIYSYEVVHMKRQSTLLATIFFLLGTVLLVKITNTRAADAQILSAALLEKGAIPVDLTAAPATPSSEPSPDPTPSPEQSPRPVPVYTVEEAWDEEARKTQPEPEPREITLGDNATLELRNETDYDIDFSALPALTLEGAGEGPAILIMHTHGSESYAESVENQGTVFRTQDAEKSVVAVGEVLAEQLRAAGFSVIHDKTMCDVPDFNSAYSSARQVVEAALAEHPSIFLVLDIHRDAVENPDGSQMRMVTEDGGSARLMLVVGTDAGGLDHPNWRENLSLGAILHTRLEGAYPGLMRPLNLRTERFNQDLGQLSLLVEVGASGNTLDEAKAAAARLGEQLGALLQESGGKSS